jgi:hypothetical protein
MPVLKSLPDLLDYVACAFPLEETELPGYKIRPVLVLDVIEKDPEIQVPVLIVAYTSSRDHLVHESITSLSRWEEAAQFGKTESYIDLSTVAAIPLIYQYFPKFDSEKGIVIEGHMVKNDESAALLKKIKKLWKDGESEIDRRPMEIYRDIPDLFLPYSGVRRRIFKSLYRPPPERNRKRSSKWKGRDFLAHFHDESDFRNLYDLENPSRPVVYDDDNDISGNGPALG